MRINTSLFICFLSLFCATYVVAAPATNTELKVTVPASQNAKVLQNLALTASSATLRDVYFYETKALTLFHSGVILRSRKTKNGDDDSTIKIRPMTSNQAANSWFSKSGFKCEIDKAGSVSTPACSFTVVQTTGEIDAVAKKTRTIDKLFSSDQESFLSTYKSAPSWGNLSIFGPIKVRVWKVSPTTLSSDVTIEEWTLPNATKIVELSTRVPTLVERTRSAAFTRWIGSKGLSSSQRQETKTKAALDYFATH